MGKPNRAIAVLLCIAVFSFSLCAPRKVFASFSLWDKDVWVTTGIITGITIGVCLVIVLVAGTLTDIFGESEEPFFAEGSLLKIAGKTGDYGLLPWGNWAVEERTALPNPRFSLELGAAPGELSSCKDVWLDRTVPVVLTCREGFTAPPPQWKGAQNTGSAGGAGSVFYFPPAEEP